MLMSPKTLTTYLLFSLALISTAGIQVAQGEGEEKYYISLDSNGVIFDGSFNHKYLNPTIETSSGDGLGWIYYPDTERYYMWFANGPYDEDSTTQIEFHAFLATVDANERLSYEMRVGWTNSSWTDSNSPPMPEDMPTEADERRLLWTGTTYSQEDTLFSENSTYEPGTSNLKARTYRPAWVFVSLSGHNFWVWRWLRRTNVQDSELTSGACCNTSTGQCYISNTGSCYTGYTYLGDDTTCDDCTTMNYDYGDAPATYPVLLSDNGARHAIDNSLYLGNSIDGESDGSPGSTAEDDTSDDGIIFLTELKAGEAAIAQVTTSGVGILNAWLDYNGDGDWDDDNEQIATDLLVSSGDNYISFDVPSTATSGSSYARFRLSSSSGLQPYGTAADGEVEDYLVILTSDGSTSEPIAVDPNTQPLAFVSQPSVWTNSNSAVIIGLPLDSASLQGPLVMDDWTYSGQYPVQGIRWWGTFNDWTTSSLPSALPDAFQISIWSSDNSGAPDVMLWEMTTNQWTWAYSGQLQDVQGLYSGQSVFEFTVLLSQDEWFNLGTELAGQYWIGIAAEYDTVPTESWSWLAQAVVNQDAALQVNQVYNGWPADFDSTILSSSTVEYPTNVTWDMAFELISSQSLSQSGLLGDMNNDGVINATDLALLMEIVIQ